MHLVPSPDLADQVALAFRQRHGHAPEVIGRAPGRVNLIGEHTDYNAGLCLPMALPHSTWAALRRRTDRQARLTSSQRPDDLVTIDLDQVTPGSVPGWAAYAVGMAWALGRAGWRVPGFDLHVDSTVPVGSGLSSSAALECAVGVGLAGLTGTALAPDVRRELVAAGVRAEREMAGAPTGGMDQSVAMLGSPEAALLLDFASGESTEVRLPMARVGLELLVIDTRVTHALTDGGYAARRTDCEAASAELGVGSLREASLDDVNRLGDARLRRRARHVVTEIARVEEAVAAIRSGDWRALGTLFEASHRSMRDDFEISCPELDTVVTAATAAGAIGARMTGGGFGGSAIALVSDDQVDVVLAAVDEAFADSGFAAPQALVARPSAGAEVVACA